MHIINRYLICNAKHTSLLLKAELIITSYHKKITSKFNPSTGGGIWVWPRNGEAGWVNWSVELPYGTTNTTSLKALVDHQRKSQLTLVGLYYSKKYVNKEPAGIGHSILVYGTPDKKKNYYIFKAYDPNNLKCRKTQNLKGLYELRI